MNRMRFIHHFPNASVTCAWRDFEATAFLMECARLADEERNFTVEFSTKHLTAEEVLNHDDASQG